MDVMDRCPEKLEFVLNSSIAICPIKVKAWAICVLSQPLTICSLFLTKRLQGAKRALRWDVLTKSLLICIWCKTSNTASLLCRSCLCFCVIACLGHCKTEKQVPWFYLFPLPSSALGTWPRLVCKQKLWSSQMGKLQVFYAYCLYGHTDLKLSKGAHKSTWGS